MKILVVEDEKELAEGIMAIFEQHGYDVDICFNGIDGRDRLYSGKYDAAVLDIMMPGQDGLSVVRDVRKEGIVTPLILLTAKDHLEDKVRGLDCGADDYITKPFEAEELLARVRARTRNSHMTDVDTLTYGDISLSRQRQELCCGTRKVKLGHKEYELMEYLLINGGRILTKDMLISKIWDPVEEPEYNHLEVYISFLRKKLRFVKAASAIVTTKNVGYSLEEAVDG